MPVLVLIADDHVFYREGILSLLNNAPDIIVVGEASTGEEVIAKAADKDELVRAIFTVKQGEAIFRPAIARRMINYFSLSTQPERSRPDTDFPDLTERERDFWT